MLNKYPYTPGHLMIAPRRHVADFADARADERSELADLLQVALRVLRAACAPHGFNAGMNLGASAGAGVVGHYHLHVVPRWTGDANFMPLVGATRVFIEDLDTTFRRLRPLFDEEKSR
jgi:ATP adenylyltransferase